MAAAGAGLPLIIITILALVVLASWMAWGPGSKKWRVALGCTLIASLAACWYVLFLESTIAEAGEWALSFALLIGIATLFVPLVWKVFSGPSQK